MPADPLPAHASAARTPRSRLLRAAAGMDRVSEFMGHLTAGLLALMILVAVYNVAARYVGRFAGTNLSSNAYLELQWYLFSLIFLLGAAYALKRDDHVRVDVLFGRLPPRARAWIDLLGTVLFLIPFSLLMLWTSWPAVRASWAVRELSPDPGGLPRYPIKAVLLLSFVLLILQGVAELLKRIAVLRGHNIQADGP